jgi:hypothetical protein
MPDILLQLGKNNINSKLFLSGIKNSFSEKNDKTNLKIWGLFFLRKSLLGNGILFRFDVGRFYYVLCIWT